MAPITTGRRVLCSLDGLTGEGFRRLMDHGQISREVKQPVSFQYFWSFKGSTVYFLSSPAP